MLRLFHKYCICFFYVYFHFCFMAIVDSTILILIISMTMMFWKKSSKKQDISSVSNELEVDEAALEKKVKMMNSSKSCKQLLGELYADKEFLESLLNETGNHILIIHWYITNMYLLCFFKFMNTFKYWFIWYWIARYGKYKGNKHNKLTLNNIIFV